MDIQISIGTFLFPTDLASCARVCRAQRKLWSPGPNVAAVTLAWVECMYQSLAWITVPQSLTCSTCGCVCQATRPVAAAVGGGTASATTVAGTTTTPGTSLDTTAGTGTTHTPGTTSACCIWPLRRWFVPDESGTGMPVPVAADSPLMNRLKNDLKETMADTRTFLTYASAASEESDTPPLTMGLEQAFQTFTGIIHAFARVLCPLDPAPAQTHHGVLATWWFRGLTDHHVRILELGGTQRTRFHVYSTRSLTTASWAALCHALKVYGRPHTKTGSQLVVDVSDLTLLDGYTPVPVPIFKLLDHLSGHSTLTKLLVDGHLMDWNTTLAMRTLVTSCKALRELRIPWPFEVKSQLLFLETLAARKSPLTVCEGWQNVPSSAGTQQQQVDKRVFEAYVHLLLKDTRLRRLGIPPELSSEQLHVLAGVVRVGSQVDVRASILRQYGHFIPLEEKQNAKRAAVASLMAAIDCCHSTAADELHGALTEEDQGNPWMPLFSAVLETVDRL